MKRVNLQVSGMHCEGCVSAVRAALEGVPGVTVEDVRVGSATIAADDQTELAKVIDAVYDAGYEAEEQV